MNIKIKDGDELFILQSAWTFAFRNVVNCILGCGEELGKVRIGIY
nr:MAG TPA: Importin subunit beta-3, Nucleoporin NUP53 repeat, nuclear import, PROTEIN.8A [Caudoviricetes sp.]